MWIKFLVNLKQNYLTNQTIPTNDWIMNILLHFHIYKVHFLPLPALNKLQLLLKPHSAFDWYWNPSRVTSITSSISNDIRAKPTIYITACILCHDNIISSSILPLNLINHLFKLRVSCRCLQRFKNNTEIIIKEENVHK